MGRPMTEAGRLRRQISLTLDDASDIRREINEVLLAYGFQVTAEMQEAVNEVSKEAVKKLQAESRKHGWNKYAAGWKFDKKNGNLDSKAIIYNGKHGSLTHLLENGHEKILWGRSTGERVEGVPHIAPVNEWVTQELPKRIDEKLTKEDK